MKLARPDRDVETFGLEEKSGFQIKATAKAFEILSSGLYKDKITAILREIGANAHDAHTDAGISDEPFVVHLPTTIEPFLSIRDFGKGLSHELMTKLYQTYFGSLKEETNDLIGGLGLGSKSPFAYTDAYTAISRFGGEKRTYDLFKDDHGEPQIALRSTEPLEDGERTGLEVIVPIVNNYDAREFVTKAQAVFEHYPVKPKFIGAQFPGVNTHNTLIEGKGWRITDRGGSNAHYHRASNARAIMGVVAYPIDSDQAIPQDDANAIKDLERARRILGAAIDIEFKIGDLDITAGREELSYVKQTKAALRHRLVQVADEIDLVVQDKFKNCKTLLEAKKLYGKLFGYDGNGYRNNSVLLAALGQDYTVKFRGVEINSTVFDINMEKFPKSKLVLYKDSKRGSHKFTKDFKAPPPAPAGQARHHYRDEREYILRIDAQEKVPTEFFIDDLDSVGHHSARIFHYRVTAPGRPKVILVQASGQELKALKEALDGYTFRKVSELEKPTYDRSTTKAKLRVLAPHCYKSSHDSIIGPREGPWNDTEVDVEKGGIFVLSNRGKIMFQNDDDCDRLFSKVFLNAVRLDLISVDEPIIAVPLSLAKQFTTTKKYEGKWTNFFDLVKERGNKKLDKAAQQLIVTGLSHTSFQSPGRSETEFTQIVDRIATELRKHHPINKFLELLTQQSVPSGDWRDLYELAQFCGIVPKGKAADLNAEWKSITDRYPLIRFVIGDYQSLRQVPDMVAYIKAMDIAGPRVGKSNTAAKPSAKKVAAES